MKDLKGVSPERFNLLQQIEFIEIDIVTSEINMEMFLNHERKELHRKLEQLYTKRSKLKRQLKETP